MQAQQSSATTETLKSHRHVAYTSHPSATNKSQKDCGASGWSGNYVVAKNYNILTLQQTNLKASNLLRCYMRPRHVGTAQPTQASAPPFYRYYSMYASDMLALRTYPPQRLCNTRKRSAHVQLKQN
eukprot:TRINITY_DN385_c0_g2_i4.p2 TRINITY_DN385_c0_g2~~TRINITY_DN385_c0_g2_i4.p2  ORF type:complete len:126 (+),score=3.48 TRINITY_DN385_c0_g2_i4:251-628(+)